MENYNLIKKSKTVHFKAKMIYVFFFYFQMDCKLARNNKFQKKENLNPLYGMSFMFNVEC